MNRLRPFLYRHLIQDVAGFRGASTAMFIIWLINYQPFLDWTVRIIK